MRCLIITQVRLNKRPLQNYAASDLLLQRMIGGSKNKQVSHLCLFSDVTLFLTIHKNTNVRQVFEWRALSNMFQMSLQRGESLQSRNRSHGSNSASERKHGNPNKAQRVGHTRIIRLRSTSVLRQTLKQYFNVCAIHINYRFNDPHVVNSKRALTFSRALRLQTSALTSCQHVSLNEVNEVHGSFLFLTFATFGIRCLPAAVDAMFAGRFNAPIYMLAGLLKNVTTTTRSSGQNVVATSSTSRHDSTQSALRVPVRYCGYSRAAQLSHIRHADTYFGN